MNSSNRKIGIIGSGIAGMAAAIELAHAGYHVEIFEKNESPGGRGRSFTEGGFTYDMGPSWYWMPEIFESFFNEFGKSTKDYFELIRLDPSYRMFFKEGLIDAPAQMEQINRIFEDLEPGSSLFLEKFLKDAKIKYEGNLHRM
jgi:phytoene desaturase